MNTSKEAWKQDAADILDYTKENWIHFLIVALLLVVVVVWATSHLSGDFLDGNTYQQTDSVATNTVRFDNDTMFYVAETDTIMMHRSVYTLIHTGDSTYVIAVAHAPDWWASGGEYSWLIMKTDYGFYSEKSRKRYYKNNDINFKTYWRE